MEHDLKAIGQQIGERLRAEQLANPPNITVEAPAVTVEATQINVDAPDVNFDMSSVVAEISLIVRNQEMIMSTISKAITSQPPLSIDMSAVTQPLMTALSMNDTSAVLLAVTASINQQSSGMEKFAAKLDQLFVATQANAEALAKSLKTQNEVSAQIMEAQKKMYETQERANSIASTPRKIIEDGEGNPIGVELDRVIN